MATFRAGGATSRINSLRVADSADEGSGHKTALTPTYFSRNHFSSPLADAADPMMKRTRIVVKVLEGKNLLVSDLLTGTSDPLVLLWVGSHEEGNVDLKQDRRVQSTEVCKHTVDPVWDAEFVFPLAIQSVHDVMNGRVNLLVRDRDDADGDVHYVDLGQASISLATVVTEGNIMAHTHLIQLPARWYSLQPCRRMKRCRGALKIAVGFFVGPDSVLLRDEDSNTLEQGTSSAAHFKHQMRRFRAGQGVSGCVRPLSMSPPRRTPITNRELTVRGGTTFLRPKSAPEATTLTSPSHLRERPFELKPVHPRFPAKDFEGVGPTPADVEGCWKEHSSATNVAETPPASESRPRWRDTFLLPQGQPNQQNAVSSSADIGRSQAQQDREECEEERLVDGLPAQFSQVATQAKPSQKLSRLAANAAHETRSRAGSPGPSAGRYEDGGAIARAHRWQRRLLESIQRLDTRSTEGAAYGELRAMAREASPAQVGQVVTAARGIGSASSLSARRRILRLLAWLCWDQPRAAGRHSSSIIAYVIERVRDDETASLRDDLAACVGAVMLSALRAGTAEACMVQTRRFLRLVGEQRLQVRESAGVCCVASVRPCSPHVPLEAEVGVGSIDDVRLAIGQAVERGGIPNAVPKDLILLPGGRAVIELADAEIAASFVDRMTLTSGGLPSNWTLHPFPEGFCAAVNLAQQAHHNKVTVNSEEILASLLEALGNGRSEATRAQLFKTMAAMAESCVIHARYEHCVPNLLVTTTVAAEVREPRGMIAALEKGLPAIVCAVLEVLECPVRRVYTWKERKAALEVIASLAVLADLRGVEGPLGEYRTKLIEGATKGKHDSVAAVREAARESLSVLEATEAEERQRTNRTYFSGRAGMAFKWGGSSAMSAVEKGGTRQTGKRRYSRGVGKDVARKTLDEALMKAKRRETTAADVRHHTNGGSQGSCEVNREAVRPRQEEIAEDIPQPKTPASLTPSISSTKGISRPARDVEQQDLSHSSLGDSEQSHDSTSCDGMQPCDHDQRRPHGANSRISHRDEPREDVPSRRDSSKRLKSEWESKWSDGVNGSVPSTKDDEKGGPEHKAAGTWRAVELEATHVPIESVATSTAQPPRQSSLPLGMVGAQNSLRGVAPSDKSGCAGSTEDRATTKAPTALRPLVLGDVQVDTVRLLKDLNSTTKRIAYVLDGLDRRLREMEPKLKLQERPVLSDDSSTCSPIPRKLKRRRSSTKMGSGKVVHTSRKETPNIAWDKKADKAPSNAVGRGAKKCATRRTTRVTHFTKSCLEKGDVEGAFRTVLLTGTERDVLRLMGGAGGPDLCRHRLGIDTCDRLFAFIARAVSRGWCIEHVLPWIFELVRAGEAKALSLAVRMQLAGALHGLAASPTDQGVMAARLGPYLSLVSVGRSSMSDVAVGGGVFTGMGLAAGGV